MINKINFQKINSVHLIGIKGVGMTALAAYLKDRKIAISGSDIAEEFITDQTLRKMGLSWWENFSANHITDQQLVIATGSAHQGPNNIEAQTAIRKGLPYLTHGEALGEAMKEKIGISVCGVGGKTTTSAMMATLMFKIGLNPSFVVGAGEIFPLGLPGRFSQKGKYFIAEADEYVTAKGFDQRPRFDWQEPKIIICTNIEHDHPDVYPNIETTKATFRHFFSKLPRDGFLVINGDNKNNQEVIKDLTKIEVVSYGEGKNNLCQIKDISLSPGRTAFKLQYNKESWGEFVLSLPGRHNVYNAAASIVALVKLGADINQLRLAIKEFKSTKRRFEYLGQISKTVQLWDDYAHHPSQIKATLEAARIWFGQQPITTVFQPHTFSRTEKLLADFARNLSISTQVAILPVYDAGRESGDPEKTSQILVAAIKKYHQRVSFIPSREVAKKMINKIDRGIVITMGAGDVWKIGQEIINQNG